MRAGETGIGSGRALPSLHIEDPDVFYRRVSSPSATILEVPVRAAPHDSTDSPTCLATEVPLLAVGRVGPAREWTR